jgi:hypothetical protein
MALRQEIVSAISFVLRLRIGARCKRALGVRDAADAQLLAEQIVAHLERCRFRFAQEPPPRLHGTPQARTDDRDPTPGR